MNDDISKTVDAILGRISDAGLIPADRFVGCSEAQLDALARFVNLPLPTAYRHLLKKCGHFEGYTFLDPPMRPMERSTYWSVLKLNGMVRNQTRETRTPRTIPEGWLVFRYPSVCFYCPDTDIDDDPPVFEVADDSSDDLFGKPVQIADRFTDYLSLWVDEGINQRKAQLGLQNAMPLTASSDEYTGPYAQLFKFLDMIRRRPAMFIPGLQLATLETYLGGFEAGLTMHSLNEGKSFHR
ncbi:MAG: SMI1/KNR4 family protein, partial [Planctomycetaceae bacterium]|nr:SMI1/KNR4 family protein [Planctomycetaceae bacterium]